MYFLKNYYKTALNDRSVQQIFAESSLKSVKFVMINYINKIRIIVNVSNKQKNVIFEHLFNYGHDKDNRKVLLNRRKSNYELKRNAKYNICKDC